MKFIRPFVLVATLLLTATTPKLVGQLYEGRELVKVELIADTDAIVPGKPFTVGLLLRMAPNWHTYWKYSGDAGLPTDIKWNVPPGWQVGEIQWPVPLSLKDPGDIETYGYSDEILLMQQITPPDKIDNAQIKLTAEANWLVCERLCIPGSAKLQITLAKSTTSKPANESIFARYRKLLPRPWSDGRAVVAQTNRAGNEVTLTIKNAGFLTQHLFVDFYPLPDEKAIVGHPKVEKNGEELRIRIPFETSPPTQISGLLVAGQSPTDENRIGLMLSTGVQGAGAATTAPQRGILTFLVFGFIGGFILNLMPCVLPVISLKIFGFIRHAGQDRKRILRNGMAFVAGIFAWFIGLAVVLVVLKAAGHQITWAAQFTNPYFVVFLSAIVLVFALNLFGVFEVNPPQSVMRLAGATGEGDAGAFFQGVFATVLATPCTAPFLGTALGFAFTQSALVIFSMFVAVAAGMAAPYLVLSAQPAWLRFLPKPGPWMERVKQFMGFLLLATLLFLLYVLGAQRGLDGLIWAACFLLVTAIACWIKGAFLLPISSTKTRFVALAAIVILLVTGGAYFIGDKFRSSKMIAGATERGGDWQNFSPERLQDALQQGRSVFVDFTAAWCLTCKFNESSVLESAAVRDAFQRRGVVKMKADWTNGDPAITKLLQQFGRPGVPLYVLYPGKSEEPIVFPELLTKGIILDKLETISPKVAAQ